MPQMHTYPTSFQAVDNYIVHRETGRVLIGQKPKEPLWRFPGGFVDPKDASLEEAAIRERLEECGQNLECSAPKYIGNFRVQDPRYLAGPDKIMSAIFKSFYIFGFEEAGDDLRAVKWVTKDYLRRNYQKMIMPVHHKLVEMLIELGEL